MRARKIEEECQQENEDVDYDEEAELAAGQGGEQMLDPYMAVHSVKVS
jgi:hypothetical protein